MIELPEDDDELLAELGRVLQREDPMPAGVVAAARGAMVWRSVEAELASLAADSLEAAVAGVRGSGDRQLTFEAASLCVEVDVVDGGQHLVGQVVPAREGTIEIEGPLVQRSSHLDRYGQFTFDAPLGPARFRVRSPGGADVVTDWVTL